ncbi:probable cleavage and polyadenylation specificity factor subunit 2-like, putative [Babesia ovis]|uniref:Cleavage and polyadenylation specificity factor subunit 2 n=1 Tax=Babesia ovis TaxID=5869 RepID=A0A9W5TCM9_BABOV|nr:probable cleavage and polyadenylation specificity factor subunit 2-like, putative [Babesia ovis]
MASLVAEPLICGSLLATKVTLRLPLSIFRPTGSTPVEHIVKAENPETSSASQQKASTTRSSRSTRKSTKASTRNSKNDGSKKTTDETDASEGFAEIHVLVNCGWSLDFEPESIDLLKQHVADIDIIALTDGDFTHIGALPVIYSWLQGLRGRQELPPVLCTEGCYKFARACLVDVLDNATFSYKFDDYTLSDLELLYTGCRTLRYSESFYFTKSGDGWSVQVSLLPLNNGVSIGGAIWRLDIGTRTIICGPTYRVQSAWYLDGCDVLSLKSADVFITHEQPRICNQPKKPFVMECNSMRSILSVIAGTLRSHGSVLIPIDVGSHVIDLLLHLNAVWSNTDLQQYPVVLVSPIAVKLVLLFATCLEYMRSGICHNFLRTLWNPIFNMKFIHPVSSVEEIRRYANMPCVFISTCSSLDFGVTSYLFAALSSYEHNSIIFTNETSGVSKLLEQYRELNMQTAEDGLHQEFDLRLNLEQPEEVADADMGRSIRNSSLFTFPSEPTDEANVQLGDKHGPHGDVVMENFGEELTTEFLFKNTRNFVIHNGGAAHVPPTIIRDDIENREKRIDRKKLDYGIPYTAKAAADLDYNFLSPTVVPYVEQPSKNHDTSVDENPINTYYMQHLDNVGADNMFGSDKSSGPQHVDKCKLVSKRLPIIIKSGLYITRYFHHHPDCELIPLLEETRPRSVSVLPTSTNLDTVSAMEARIHDTVPSCSTFFIGNTGVQTKDKANTGRHQVTIPLDLRQVLLNRSTTLFAEYQALWQLSTSVSPSPPKSLRIQPRLSKLMTVLKSVDNWKRVHNPRRTFQAIVRFHYGKEEDGSDATNHAALECTSFWTKRTPSVPCLSLSIPGDTTHQPCDPDKMDLDSASPEELSPAASKSSGSSDLGLTHSVSRSLYTGNVPMPTLVGYIEECLPDSCALDHGVVTVNGSSQISRSETRYGMHRWNVRGTLDPSFYFSRKMLRSLHNRIEPLY